MSEFFINLLGYEHPKDAKLLSLSREGSEAFSRLLHFRLDSDTIKKDSDTIKKVGIKVVFEMLKGLMQEHLMMFYLEFKGNTSEFSHEMWPGYFPKKQVDMTILANESGFKVLLRLLGKKDPDTIGDIYEKYMEVTKYPSRSKDEYATGFSLEPFFTIKGEKGGYINIRPVVNIQLVKKVIVAGYYQNLDRSSILSSRCNDNPFVIRENTFSFRSADGTIKKIEIDPIHGGDNWQSFISGIKYLPRMEGMEEIPCNDGEYRQCCMTLRQDKEEIKEEIKISYLAFSPLISVIPRWVIPLSVKDGMGNKLPLPDEVEILGEIIKEYYAGKDVINIKNTKVSINPNG